MIVEDTDPCFQAVVASGRGPSRGTKPWRASPPIPINNSTTITASALMRWPGPKARAHDLVAEQQNNFYVEAVRVACTNFKLCTVGPHQQTQLDRACETYLQNGD
jgi:hypothetical protein